MKSFRLLLFLLLLRLVHCTLNCSQLVCESYGRECAQLDMSSLSFEQRQDLGVYYYCSHCLIGYGPLEPAGFYTGQSGFLKELTGIYNGEPKWSQQKIEKISGIDLQQPLPSQLEAWVKTTIPISPSAESNGSDGISSACRICRSRGCALCSGLQSDYCHLCIKAFEFFEVSGSGNQLKCEIPSGMCNPMTITILVLIFVGFGLLWFISLLIELIKNFSTIILHHSTISSWVSDPHEQRHRMFLVFTVLLSFGEAAVLLEDNNVRYYRETPRLILGLCSSFALMFVGMYPVDDTKNKFVCFGGVCAQKIVSALHSIGALVHFGGLIVFNFLYAIDQNPSYRQNSEPRMGSQYLICAWINVGLIVLFLIPYIGSIFYKYRINERTPLLHDENDPHHSSVSQCWFAASFLLETVLALFTTGMTLSGAWLRGIHHCQPWPTLASHLQDIESA